MLSEDGAGVGVDLGEGDGAPSCSFKSDVHASDTGEEGCVGERTAHPCRDGSDPATFSPIAVELFRESNASGWKRTSELCVLTVRLRSSDNSGPFPPPGFPSRIRSNVGRIHRATDSNLFTRSSAIRYATPASRICA